MGSLELIFIHFNTINGTFQDHKPLLNNNNENVKIQIKVVT